MLSGSLLIIHGDEAPKMYVKHIRQWLQAQKQVQYPVLITGRDGEIVQPVLQALSDICYNTNDYMTLDQLLTLHPHHYKVLAVVGPKGVVVYHEQAACQQVKRPRPKPGQRITSQPYQYPLHLVS